MGAMFGTRDGSVFLRFRNGDDPNEKKLRAAPAGGGVHIENKSHIVLRDLMIRGGENCVLITGPEATHNVVERCRLLNGAKRVRLTEGAAHNTIRDSEMTIDFYAGSGNGITQYNGHQWNKPLRTVREEDRCIWCGCSFGSGDIMSPCYGEEPSPKAVEEHYREHGPKEVG